MRFLVKKPLKPYRHEMKYIIDEGTYRVLRQRFMAAMTPDSHAKNGEYRITSLYFDDVYRSAYNDKMNGDLVRKKYRIRAYDLSPEFIKLECKGKEGDYGLKRSARLTREQYEMAARGDLSFCRGSEFEDTVAEDMIISNALIGLRPHVLVDYVREPYINREGNVRITFDKRLGAGINTLDMFDENVHFEPVMAGLMILEVKYDSYIPSYIQELLSGVPLMRGACSKYALCSDKLLEITKAYKY